MDDRQKLIGRFPRASKDFIALNSPGLPAAKPERYKAKSLVKAVQIKEASLGRARVRFEGYFVRPQDPDNFAASTKDLCDGLWRCGLISGDAIWDIEATYHQSKVASFPEERIEITITWGR